jgi:hypothetical protein
MGALGPSGLQKIRPMGFAAQGDVEEVRDGRCFSNSSDTSKSDAAVVSGGEKDDCISMDLLFVPWYQTRHR